MALTVPNREDWFDNADSFPRPNWGAVNGWMRVFATTSELDNAWQQWARHWLDRLRAGLGGDYAVGESENFQLLSEHAPEARAKWLSFFERTRSHFYKVLGDIAPADAPEKHLILRFTETDDYYVYVAHFFPDGEYAGSTGMFLRDGYYHIAYPQSWNGDEERRIVAHELTHNLLSHLPLPVWLNEALAMAFETDIAGSGNEPLSRDLIARHREYWNPATIQEFWRGESFSDVGGQEVAYSLSRILLNLISTEIRPPEGNFRRFVLRADWGDGGAIAAREHLEIELENLVATFLGPGDWAPRPKTWRRVPGPDEDDVSPEAQLSISPEKNSMP